MTLAALLLLSSFDAGACSCTRMTVLPDGSVCRPGQLEIGLDYSLSHSGDPAIYDGIYLEDLHGDSMAGMRMPPHRIQSWLLSTSVGLPASLTALVDVPYTFVHLLGPSDMPGAADQAAFGDVSAQLRWGRILAERIYLGVSAGPSFPTGEVVPGSPVRLGRGALGIVGQVQASGAVAPRLELAASLSGADAFGSDEGGYHLGADVQGALGGRFSPRENGPVTLSAFTMLRWQDQDREDALIYANTGYLSHDLVLGGSWRVWAKGSRSATLSARASAPLWQIVGDPMYAENFAVGLGATVAGVIAPRP